TWTCDGGVSAVADGKDQWKIQWGAITLVVVVASADEAARYDQWLADSRAQQATCRAAAACCAAAEPSLGACDLKTQLGDRSLAACRAGLERVRSALDAKKVALPEACRGAPAR
ncbi:MAG: hypothetical protein HY902_02405, partial [Deltaproteobacteria bacterium]|nr:hypothetical protein [Deltaproteobacteria bacterium]